MLDLEPAAQQMSQLLDGIADTQLAAATPCPDYTLGDLVDHVGGLALAFTMAATKERLPGPPQGPSGDATRLEADWRTRIPERLDALVEAWRNGDAWEGMTQAGGVDLPGDVAGRVALNELVIHGWDVAAASGQRFEVDPVSLEATLEFVAPMSEPGADRGGLFGPVVEVPADSPLLDRVIGLSGREPSWSSGSARRTVS